MPSRNEVLNAYQVCRKKKSRSYGKKAHQEAEAARRKTLDDPQIRAMLKAFNNLLQPTHLAAPRLGSEKAAWQPTPERWAAMDPQERIRVHTELSLPRQSRMQLDTDWEPPEEIPRTPEKNKRRKKDETTNQQPDRTKKTKAATQSLPAKRVKRRGIKWGLLI